MWTKKATFIMSLGIGLIVISLIQIFGNNLALMSAGIFIIAYSIVSLFSNRQTKLEPQRKLSNEKIFEDGTVNAEVRIKNRGGATGFVEACDKLPPSMDVVKGGNYSYLNLKARSEGRISYTVKAPIKGMYNIGPVQFRSHDPFNMFYKELKVEYESTLTVFPQVRDVKELYIKSKQPKIYPGEMRVKMPGPGTDFFSIRDYVAGDPFKAINWKAWARTRRKLVNEKERLSVSDITIVFDSRYTSDYGMLSDNPNVYGARAAATLTNFFLKRRDSVQLVVYGDKVRTIKKGSGQKQLFEILTGLAGAVPKGDIPLNGIVEVAIPYMPRRSPVIIISSLDEDDSVRKAISTMRILQFDITIISPSSLDFEIMAKEKAGSKDIDQTAYDVLKLERDIMIQDLRGYGARVIDWKPDAPLLQILSEARNVPARGGSEV
jgi:uncharacterized protein (DUF58 family)